MTSLLIKTELSPMTVDLSSLIPQVRITDDQFIALCHANRDLRIERTAEGQVIVMSPAFADTGNRNSRIIQQLTNWSDQVGMGEVFDSSSGFTLPNGAIRAPDAAWISLKRWDQLSDDQKASFSPICPDFVVELRSVSDSLASVQDKMQEYINNGSQLGLLIDRKSSTVHVYRLGCQPELLLNPNAVICDPELPGFTLQMAKIW